MRYVAYLGRLLVFEFLATGDDEREATYEVEKKVYSTFFGKKVEYTFLS